MRGWLKGALLSVCVGCGSAAPPPPPSFSEARAFNPLVACTTTEFGRYTRSVQCRDTHMLFVSRPLSPERLLQVRRAQWSAYGLPADTRSLLVAGHDLPSLGSYMGSFESAQVAVLSTPLAYAGSDESIEALCFHYGGPVDPKRCASLLEAFVKQGITRGEWPSVLAARDPQTAQVFDVVGREVRLPGSCDFLGPFDVDCREGHIRLLIAETAEQLPQMLKADLAVAVDGKLLLEWEVPCRVEGVETTCNVRRYRSPYDELFVYRATAEVRGAPMFVSCETKKSQSPQLPGGICSQFLAFDAEALVLPKLPGEEE